MSYNNRAYQTHSSASKINMDDYQGGIKIFQHYKNEDSFIRNHNLK